MSSRFKKGLHFWISKVSLMRSFQLLLLRPIIYRELKSML